MLYTLIFYLIYLCHSFARRTWRREIEEWERRKEGWRGRFAQKKKMRRSDFQSDYGLRAEQVPEFAQTPPRSNVVFDGAGEAFWDLDPGTWWNSMIAQKKTFSGASLRLTFSPSSQCALHYWTLFEVDSSVLQRHLTKTKWGGGYSGRLLEMLRDNCILNAFSVNSNMANSPTWEISTQHSRSFLLPSNCNLVASVFDSQPYSSIWKWACVHESVSGVCAWACGHKGVCLTIIAP